MNKRLASVADYLQEHIKDFHARLYRLLHQIWQFIYIVGFGGMNCRPALATEEGRCMGKGEEKGRGEESEDKGGG